MLYKTDYHIHTTFSDGKASPEDYISQAVKSGIAEIGFSEHLSLFGERQDWCMDPVNVAGYLSYMENLERNTTGITIRKGLEVDYWPGREAETEEFLGTLDLDYRIGSVHYLGEKSVDNEPVFYEGKNIDLLYDSYFDMVISAAGSGLFDIIAHCDLIRIYGYKPASGQEHNYRRLARALKSHNVAFELNTNGRNRPLGDFYPDRKFLHIFREEEVPVCVNSDAHMPVRVGQFFDEAYMLLASAGFNEMAVFEKRQRTMMRFSI